MDWREVINYLSRGAQATELLLRHHNLGNNGPAAAATATVGGGGGGGGAAADAAACRFCWRRGDVVEAVVVAELAGGMLSRCMMMRWRSCIVLIRHVGLWFSETFYINNKHSLALIN